MLNNTIMEENDWNELLDLNLDDNDDIELIEIKEPKIKQKTEKNDGNFKYFVVSSICIVIIVLCLFTTSNTSCLYNNDNDIRLNNMEQKLVLANERISEFLLNKKSNNTSTYIKEDNQLNIFIDSLKQLMYDIDNNNTISNEEILKCNVNKLNDALITIDSLKIIEKNLTEQIELIVLEKNIFKQSIHDKDEVIQQMKDINTLNKNRIENLESQSNDDDNKLNDALITIDSLKIIEKNLTEQIELIVLEKNIFNQSIHDKDEVIQQMKDINTLNKNRIENLECQSNDDDINAIEKKILELDDIKVELANEKKRLIKLEKKLLTNSEEDYKKYLSTIETLELNEIEKNNIIIEKMNELKVLKDNLDEKINEYELKQGELDKILAKDLLINNNSIYINTDDITNIMNLSLYSLDILLSNDDFNWIYIKDILNHIDENNDNKITDEERLKFINSLNIDNKFIIDENIEKEILLWLNKIEYAYDYSSIHRNENFNKEMFYYRFGYYSFECIEKVCDIFLSCPPKIEIIEKECNKCIVNECSEIQQCQEEIKCESCLESASIKCEICEECQDCDEIEEIPWHKQIEEKDYDVSNDGKSWKLKKEISSDLNDINSPKKNDNYLNFASLLMGSKVYSSSPTYIPPQHMIDIGLIVKDAANYIGIDLPNSLKWLHDGTLSIQDSSRLLNSFGLESGVGIPEDSLKNDMSIGSCWPMKGSQGTLVIKLKSLILIENISIEHISKSAGSDIRTSLKDFKIYGMNSNNIKNEILLVDDGLYDINSGDTAQIYSIKNKNDKVDMVKLYILSNYGNVDYTCLYNIKVNSIIE